MGHYIFIKAYVSSNFHVFKTSYQSHRILTVELSEMETACIKFETTIQNFSLLYEFPAMFGTQHGNKLGRNSIFRQISFHNLPKYAFFKLITIFSFIYTVGIGVTLVYYYVHKIHMTLIPVVPLSIIGLEGLCNLSYDVIFYLRSDQINWTMREVKKLSKFLRIMLPNWKVNPRYTYEFCITQTQLNPETIPYINLIKRKGCFEYYVVHSIQHSGFIYFSKG